MAEAIGPEVLDKIEYPAFLVSGKTIKAINKPAEKYGIPLGKDVNTIINTGLEEHKAFKNGRLCLTLKIENMLYCASVIRVARRREIFYIESEIIDPALHAVSAAAFKFKEPLTEAMSSVENFIAKNNDIDKTELKSLYRNLNRMYRTVVNMADASSFTKERSYLVETCDVSSEINEIIKKADEYLQQSPFRLVYTPYQETIYSLLDKEKLERAILNMISSAAKLSQKNSNITVKLQCFESSYCFSVTAQWIYANTVGINDIFNAYRRKPNDICDEISMGLSTTIARNAATAHGGTLLYDQPDKNSIRFTLTLPIVQEKNLKLNAHLTLPLDYCGGYDRYLVELSDILSDEPF